MNIKAGIITAPFVARVGDVEVKEPGPADVVIRTEFSFISNGTETHVHRQEFPEPPHQYPFPFVIGYQAAGIIEQIGTAGTGLRVGDRVFTWSNQVKGLTNALGGVHAERIVAPAGAVLPVPDGVEALSASAAVVAQVGYNGASRLPDQKGAVLVLGDGIIGQFAAQAALARGWHVLLAGRHARRLLCAQAAFPAVQTTDSDAGALRDQARQILGTGPDAVIDSVGSPDSLALSQAILPAHGHLIVLGWWAGNQTLNVHAAFNTEATVHFPAGLTPIRLSATLALIRTGAIAVRPLVTHTFAGADFPKACRLLKQRGSDYLGIAIDWRD
jgi:3-hydroxyethyl bacteriochlorophyllide a dehydrogenase